MTRQWFTASAPGKFVILGEHSVVYGKPAIILAADLRLRCSIRRSDVDMINGLILDRSKQPHVDYLTKDLGYPLEIESTSKIPLGSGMGSSAAFSAALAKAISMERGEDLSQEELVRKAYGAELNAQGSGSPMDASTCVHGGGVAINMPNTNDGLWTISRGERTWDVSDIPVPEMSFVIGNTGISSPTGPQVMKVRRYYDKGRFAKEIIDEMGTVAIEGFKALMTKDKVTLGRLMTHDHKLLSILGVSCKELNKLVEASLPYSYGAKLTGSGGGGCMVALTDKPDKVADAITRRGGKAYIVRSGVEGVRAEMRM